MAESVVVSVIREEANKSAVRLGSSWKFMTGKDVYWIWKEFVLCLPACLPFAFAEVEKSEETERPIVVVATPLTAIKVSCGRRLTCSSVMMTPICFKG